MNYSQTLRFIHSLGNFRFEAGLNRIKKVLELLGNPQNDFKSIHIAGTNGKGSVCAMLSEVFKCAGYKTGLFISPFIIDFKERIQINGEYISEQDLVFYSQKVKETEVELTEFEFITAVAFCYFRDKNIDILICETGLGGRFDATNTLDNIACAVITKIGLDHTAVLGDTIEKIAYEKCGILRDAPTVTSPYQQDKALEVIKQNAKSLIIPETQKLEIIKSDMSGNTFIYKGEKFDISLCGEYQIENAITAIETVRTSGYDITYDIIYEGLKKASFPARAEILSREPLVILDGAHNPDGAEALSKEIRKYKGKAVAIIGAMADKDTDTVFEKTLKHCKYVIAVTVENMPRSLTEKELLKKALHYCEGETAESYDEAIKKAIKIADGAPVFIFGSLYLASGMRAKFK